VVVEVVVVDLPDEAYDLRTIEILGLRHTVQLTDTEIARWFAVRAAVQAGRYHDRTMESCRLEFARRRYQAGKLTDGPILDSAPRISQVVAMVTSEEAAQMRPEYTGGGCSYPADEVPDHDG
jgi:hypothetical protein